jgi:hypothetical protein
MASVFFVGDGRLTEKYKPVDFEMPIAEIAKAEWLGVDTETTVTESILNRKLKVISVSWKVGVDYDMAVFI